MKRVFASVIVLFLLGCKDDKPKGNFELTGNIKGFKSGKLFIQRLLDTSLVAIDSIIIDGDSNFSSSFNLKSPEMLYLSIDRGTTNSLDNSLPFFAEPGKMTINTELELFFAKAKIKGSKNHTLFEDFNLVNKKFNEEILEFTVAKFQALKNKGSVLEIENKEADVVKRRYLFALNYALNNADFEVAPYIGLTQISNINLKYLDTLQKSMSPKVAKSLYGKKLVSLYNARKKVE